MHVSFWLIVAGVLLAIELSISTYYLLWIAGSALVTSCVALVTKNVLIQLLAFALVSILSYFYSRRFAKQFRESPTFGPLHTQLIHQIGVMVSDCEAGQLGTVRVSGHLWSCRPDVSLRQGDFVEVLDVNSSILVVRKSINETTQRSETQNL